jgi:ATP-dependent helicase/nuclease subunit A
MEELTIEGIPAYADVATGYFDAVEVQTVLSLLQIIDNPRQDIPLLTVLRSPIVALTCDELVQVRTAFEQGTFFEAIVKFIEMDFENTQLTRKLQKFLKDLEKWRGFTIHISIHELLWMLYTETNYYNYIGAMVGGMQRQANLRILRDRAAQYEATSFKGLFHFIRFVQKMQKQQGDLGAAKIVGENENIVRIMSIHKSKGLEFPVVVAAGMGKQFNLQDLRQSILLHQDLGLGPDYIDYEKRVIYQTMAKVAIGKKIMLENLSEEMRILYVAFTRAKEKLIITGTIRNIEEQAKKWCRQVQCKEETIPVYAVMKAKTYMDWIATAVIRHKDGEMIRDCAGIQDIPLKSLYEDDSHWKIYRWNKEDIILENQKDKKEKEQIRKQLLGWNPELSYSSQKTEIFNRLSWVYPYEEAIRFSVITSVSEIKRQYQQEAFDEESPFMYGQTALRRPQFIEQKKGLSAAEKGTLIHFVMQHLNLEKAVDFESIKNQLNEMKNKGLLSEEQIKIIYSKDILAFAASPLAERIKQSAKVKKEVPFVLSLPIKEVYPKLNVPEDFEEEVMIQGIIDCYFEEEEQVVLIDYKTDYIAKDQDIDQSIEKIKRRYQTQIDLYARAIEQITGKKVKERYLYLFSIQRSILC